MALIAGASGGVGSQAISAFVENGWDVVSLSRLGLNCGPLQARYILPSIYTT